MSLVIKACLERNGNPKAEIRRFGIPADASSSFTYVFKKVSEVFPGLVTGNFNIYWKDGEGDLISCSSDEELMEALGFVTDSIFRIFIKEHAVPSSSNDNSSSSSQALHPGVVCDGCEGPVRGIRYKCCVCPDYDLCTKCEALNRHPDHDMLKIVAPMDNDGAPRGMFRPPHHFRRWMRKYMNRWHSRKGHGETGNPCRFAGNQGRCTTMPTCADQGESPEEAYLNDVGENVAAMLDPFGIDVGFEVHHPGHPGPFRGRRRGCGAGMRYPPWFHGHGFASSARGKAPKAPSSKDEDGHMEGKDEDAHMEVKEHDANAAGPSASGETSAMTQSTLTQQDGDVTQQSGATSQSQDSTAQGDTQMEEKLKSLQIRERERSPDSDGDWQVLSNSEESQTTSTDPKITESLTQMLQMGFSNDGGWLTRLLEAKDGNISQVLDAIRPEPRHSS